MSDKQIGHVIHYYEHLHVAALALTDTLKIGDTLHIVGHTTDFVQTVTSLQINRVPVQEAQPGKDVALKVVERVRSHDVVYRITAEEARELEATRTQERSW